MIKILALGILVGVPLLAQTSLRSQILQDFVRFHSPDPVEREAAFYDLTKTGCPICSQSNFPIVDGIENAVHFGGTSQEALAQNIIALLNSEALTRDGTENLSQEYSDYLGDLVQAVCSLRDKRSVNALFSFVDSGNMAEDALAALGEGALTKARDLLDSEGPDSTTRTSAMRIIRKMAEKRNLERFDSPERGRAVVKSLLLRGLSEPNYFNRIAAVSGLAALGDRDVIPVLENVATNDAYADMHPTVLGASFSGER